MSIISAIFRKDFHQFRILIGLLIGLLAVLIAVRLEWTGSVVPDPASGIGSQQFLEGMLALFTVVIAGRLTAFVCFEDSPSRSERFLATRPVPATPLACAKLAFLAAFVVAPFAIAAALYLALSGMPFRVIALGTLQSLVRTLALLGFGVPLVLLWETRRRLIAGIAAIGAGLFALLLSIDLLARLRPPLAPFRPEAFDYPLVQVLAMSVAAICLATLACVHGLRPLRMPPRLAALFLTGVIAPLLGGLLTAHRPATPLGEVTPCTIVGCSLYWQQNQGKRTLGISLSPSTPTPPGQDLDWNFTSLSLGSHRIPLRPQSDPRLFPARFLNTGPLTAGFETALHDHLGAGWSILSSPWGGGRPYTADPASAATPEPSVPATPAKLDAVFQGNAYTWHPVAELPLKPGTSVRDGAATWTFHGSARTRDNVLRLSITHQGPDLWLDPGGRRPGFENDAHRFAVLDPGRRIAVLIDERTSVRAHLATSTACPRRGLLIQLDGLSEAGDFSKANPETLRLLILRPRYEGIRFCRWASPEPLIVRSTLPAGAEGLANTPHDLKSADIARWIDAHPGPGPDASSAEVARYLVSLLEQTNRTPPHGEDHPAVVALAAYVPGHLELFLRALGALHMDHHASRSLLQEALAAGLEHRQIPEIARHLATRPGLVGLVARRGWTADLAPDLARLIRNGNHDHTLLEAAASLPGTAGITAEEWLAIFRLQTDSETYRTLRAIPGLEPELNAIVDARLAGSLSLLKGTAVDPLLELALARGHPEGPACLQRAVRYAIKLSPHNSDYFANTITRCIDVSSGFPDHQRGPDLIAPWLLAQDPASFTFNPSTRLYTPSSPPDQNSKIKNQ